MTVHVFVEDEDVIDNVRDNPEVPDELAGEVARMVAEMAESDLSDAFMRALWAETDRLAHAAMERLRAEGRA